MKNTVVVSVPIQENYKQALDKTFQIFSEISQKIKKSKRIFIKISIDHLYEYHYIDRELLQLILEYIRRLNPNAGLFVMENNIHGNFTRLLANQTGISKICKQYKAKFLYLEEKKVTTVTIGRADDRYRIQFPEMLLDHLIVERKDCFYLNVSALRTHYQTRIAGALFNQIGLLSKLSLPFLYSAHVHNIIPYLYEYIRPDFTILDANVVLEHGMIQPESLIDKNAICINRLISSYDAVAVDRVAAECLRYKPEEIEHLQNAINAGYGEGYLRNIDIKGNIPKLRQKARHSPELTQLPQKMDIVIGEDKSGVDSCLGLMLQYLQILFKDFGGDHRFTLLAGSNFSKEQLEHLRDPVVVLGAKACRETAPVLRRFAYEAYYIEHCHDIRQIIAVLLKVQSINKYNLLGASPFATWKNLWISRLFGSKYKLPSVKRVTRRWREPKKKMIEGN
ncbi:DUF362 domain-containing protein [candidate division KSB1 bacterium]|nr:DUF362 domain-containing protein [candidate division KSB1 bacterium]